MTFFTKLIILVLFFGFWGMNFYQVFGGLREDLPFSFFGMYKGSLSNIRFQEIRFDVETWSSEENKWVEVRIPATSRNRFRRKHDLELIALGFELDRSKRTKRYREIKRDYKISPVDKERLQVYIRKEILPALRSESTIEEKPTRVTVFARVWENLTYETSKNPSFVLQIYKGVFEEF